MIERQRDRIPARIAGGSKVCRHSQVGQYLSGCGSGAVERITRRVCTPEAEESATWASRIEVSTPSLLGNKNRLVGSTGLDDRTGRKTAAAAGVIAPTS